VPAGAFRPDAADDALHRMHDKDLRQSVSSLRIRPAGCERTRRPAAGPGAGRPAALRAPRIPTHEGATGPDAVLSRALLLAMTVAIGALLARTTLWYQGDAWDRATLLFAVKALLVLAVGLHFVTFHRGGTAIWLERLAAGGRARRSVLLVALVLAPIAAALLTTPQIDFGVGRRGPGYGHDGLHYGWMAEEFAWSGRAVPAPYGYRFLPAMLVHYSGLDTFDGFRLLNLASLALASLVVFRIALALALPPAAAFLAVAYFGTAKYGAKFLVYYPVLTDGPGLLLLVVIVWATLERRHVVYLLAMAAAVATRENLLALVGFNALYGVRTGVGRRRLPGAVLLQVLPLALLWLSRRFPVFTPLGDAGGLDTALRRGSQFVLDPALQGRFLLAYANSLGVLLILPLLAWRRTLAFLGARYAWAYYLAASVGLSVVGGRDFDRFALWLAPLAIPGVLALDVRRPGRVANVAVSWLVLQVIAMEAVFPWFPDVGFYTGLSAAHATGPPLACMAAFSWILLAVVVAMRMHEPPSSARPPVAPS
jgi:hypothetical protein